MSPAQARPRWRRLGAELRRLREFAGITQREMAQALKVSQTTVDRIESGGPEGKPPAWPKIRDWAERASAAHPDLEALRDLAEAALDEHALYRNLMSDGTAAAQEEIRGQEANARTLRFFSPWGVPGLLQTAQYARRVLTLSDYQQAGDIEESLEVRQRRQEILLDPEHQVEFVVTEEGLRRRVIPAPALAVQLQHVAAEVSRPSVTFSAVPAGAPAYALPMFGFVIYEDLTDGGDPWVAIETYHDQVRTAKPDEVQIYRAQYNLLKLAAMHGDEAVAFVREVAASLERGQ